MYSSALSLVMIICVSTMMNSEKRKAPPTASAVSVSSLPKKTCRKPPRMRTMSPVHRTAYRLEKSRLVWSRAVNKPSLKYNDGKIWTLVCKDHILKVLVSKDP